MKNIPMTDLRNRLSEIGDPKEPILLTRHGHPVALVLSVPDDPEDLDSFLLAHDPHFREIVRRSRQSGFVSLDEARKRVEEKERTERPRGRGH